MCFVDVAYFAHLVEFVDFSKMSKLYLLCLILFLPLWKCCRRGIHNPTLRANNPLKNVFVSNFPILDYQRVYFVEFTISIFHGRHTRGFFLHTIESNVCFHYTSN